MCTFKVERIVSVIYGSIASFSFQSMEAQGAWGMDIEHQSLSCMFLAENLSFFSLFAHLSQILKWLFWRCGKD